jgi:hypothetical protein
MLGEPATIYILGQIDTSTTNICSGTLPSRIEGGAAYWVTCLTSCTYVVFIDVGLSRISCKHLLFSCPDSWMKLLENQLDCSSIFTPTPPPSHLPLTLLQLTSLWVNYIRSDYYVGYIDNRIVQFNTQARCSQLVSYICDDNIIRLSDRS